MAISHIGTNHATNGSATSVTVTKPAGTTTDDLLLAFFTSNNQNCSPPSGWTEIADETIEVFRTQVFYKVAGGSEPSNYQFSVSSSAPLVASVTCIRDVDKTTPIDITAVAETDTEHSEPYTTPSITGGSAGRLVYFRAVRVLSSTPATFTASGVTELKDVGVFSGGSASYSQGLYLANADYSGSGTKSGLAITTSGTDTHNFVFTVGLKAKAGVTGTIDADVPSIPTVSMAATWALAASLSVQMPMPSMTSEVFNGNFEAELDVDVPISMNIAASTPVRGELDVIPVPEADFTGETRFFAENVVIPVREERWFIMTQDGYYLGIRTGVDLPMRIEMPLPVVTIAAQSVTHADEEITASVETLEPSETIVSFAGGTTDVVTTTYDASVVPGALAMAEEVNLDTTSAWEEVSTAITFSSEMATEVQADAYNLIGASVVTDVNTVSVTAYDPIIGNAIQAPAEHVSVSATANGPESGVSNANAGHASVTVTANQGTEKVTATGGHVTLNCHN